MSKRWVLVPRLFRMKEVAVCELSPCNAVPPPNIVRVGSFRGYETIRRLQLCEIGIDRLTQGTVCRLQGGECGGVLKSGHAIVFLKEGTIGLDSIDACRSVVL